MTQETPPTPEGAGGPPRPAPRYGGPSRRDDRGPRDDRDRGGGRFGPGGLRRPRRKVCSFCVDKVQRIDFKDVGRIRRYISERGKIDPRRKSGTCAKHQRMLTAALKRARLMALLPYTADHVRGLMSPQARAMAGGPPPPKPERPPYRPGEFRPAGRPPMPPGAAMPQPAAQAPGSPQAQAAPAATPPPAPVASPATPTPTPPAPKEPAG
jgi:small subunit ribosomal protein S18